VVEGARRERQRQLFGDAPERFGVPDARLTPLRSGFTDVFHVASPSRGEFALRAYRLPRVDEDALRRDPRLRTGPGLRSPETLRAQLSWLRALGRETDLRVPEPVPADDGSLVVRVPYGAASEPRHCVLLRWLPGRGKKEELGPEDLARLGSYMARMHEHAAHYPVPEDAPLPRWDWSWPFGGSAEIWVSGPAFCSEDEMRVFRAASERVRRDLEALGEGRDVFGLVHRDLQPKNLVFDGDGTLLGAIDFDLCGRGHYLLDVAVALSSLRVHRAGDFAALREALIEGYRSVRALPKEDLDRLVPFQIMRLVSEANRELGLRNAGAGERDADYFPRLVGRLTHLLERG
jgi:Ser/Thr protein kinase RdoA (MazF antagonist)